MERKFYKPVPDKILCDIPVLNLALFTCTYFVCRAQGFDCSFIEILWFTFYGMAFICFQIKVFSK